MTDKEKLELIMEFLRRDIKFNKELAKIYADSGDYQGANNYQMEAKVEQTLIMIFRDDEFLKDHVKILRQDEQYEKALRGVNDENHN